MAYRMALFVKFVVKILLVLLKVIGSTSGLFDNDNISFAYCEHGFDTTNTRMNSKTFNIAFNIAFEVCIENCVDRPWCAGIIYDRRSLMCNIVFEEDLSFIESLSSSEQHGWTCALVKKDGFPTDALEVVHLLTVMLFFFKDYTYMYFQDVDYVCFKFTVVFFFTTKSEYYHVK